MVRIAGVQGFYGDSPMGAIRIAAAGAADFLMHDALSELTLSILQKDKLKNPIMGYARDIEAHAKYLYPIALSKGMRIVTNAGGLNPHAAAQKVQEILRQAGLDSVIIAVIDGDDVLNDLEKLKEELPLIDLDTEQAFQTSTAEPTHANVYTGAEEIARALNNDAQIVITGRVADPCLALGIMIHRFKWKIGEPEELSQGDMDLLANGIMVGHIIECGGQATGGNSYAEWQQLTADDFANLGYPIAEVSADGSAVITKLKGSGGIVNRNTVREQLVYEIHNPNHYITPDVVVDFSSIYVKDVGENRVAVGGAKGKPRPKQLKLCIGQMEGYQTEQLFYFSYPNAYQKAKIFIEAAQKIWANLPFQAEEIRFNYLGINGIHESVTPTLSDEIIEQLPEVGIRLVIRHQDKKVGKLMIQSIICLGLNGPPGIAASMTWGKAASIRLGLFPTLIPRSYIEPKITYYE